MSDSKNLAKVLDDLNLGRVTTAVIGVVIVFLIAIAANFIFRAIGGRVDLTQNNIYTLSDGTGKILKRLDTPVVVRFYVEDAAGSLSPAEQSYVRRVEDLLGEYQKLARGKLQVKRFNPEPNTDAEDSAVLDGLQRGLSRETGNEVFLGISVECIDEKETLPFLPARPETLLEYDLSRAIARVHDGAGKMVRIMTTMQIGGGFAGGNFNAPPQPGWYFVDALRRDFEVEFLPMTAEEIPAGTDVLLVLHPYDATEQSQYAIDQYLLKGGSVMIVVDPSFFAARFMTPPQMNPMMPQPGMGPEPSSDLGKLFEAWGVKYDAGQVLADMTFQTQIREGYSPTVLSLSQDALNREDPVTMRLNDVFLIMPGAFEVTEKEGITSDVLIQSSPSSQMVSSFDADPTQKANIDRLREEFQASGESKTIVMRLSGTFPTAFPDGNPAAKEEPDAEEDEEDKEGQEEPAVEEAGSGDEDKKEESKDGEDGGEGEEKKNASLKKSEKEGVVMLFADADFIYDEFCVQRQNILGQTFAIPTNGNLSLMQNALEMLSGDPELINVRSRASNRRPFTKLNEWLQKSEAKFRDQLKEFEGKAREAETNINNILSSQPENVEQALMSPEVQQELANLRQQQVELNRTVRTLQKEMKKEFDLAQFLIKLLTTGLVPVLVVATGITLAVMRRMRTAAR